MIAVQPDLELLFPILEDTDASYLLPTILLTAVVRSAEKFAVLRAEWDRLHGRSDAGVFLSWGWLYPWFRKLGAGRELHIVTARDGSGDLEGVLPMCVEERRLLGTKFGPCLRRMSFLGETHVGSDYLDVIASRENQEEVTRRLLEQVRDGGEWDVLDLNDMDSQSPTLTILQEVFENPEYELEWQDGPLCPYRELESGETFDGFIRNLGRGQNYKRRSKWLEKQEGYRIVRSTCPQEMEHALAEFLRLHDLRWRAEGGSDGIACPQVEAFHRDATSYLAETGNVCLYTMIVGEQAVASFYALVHNGKMICYLTGRDPEWQKQSVGMVLIGETFRHAFELGMREYDFLRGEEPYKADWSSQTRRLVSVRIYRKGSRGTWLSRQERTVDAARRLARKVLPSALRKHLRRIA